MKIVLKVQFTILLCREPPHVFKFSQLGVGNLLVVERRVCRLGQRSPYFECGLENSTIIKYTSQQSRINQYVMCEQHKHLRIMARA